MKVIKRNGASVDFDPERIKVAIQKASDASGHKLEPERIDLIVSELRIKDGTNIEVIQDKIIEALKIQGLYDIAQCYETYRYNKKLLRENSAELIKQIGRKAQDLDNNNSNANYDEHSFGGRKGEMGDAAANYYALHYQMSKMAAEAHINNEIYTHDLNSWSIGMHNCLVVPFHELLAKDVKTRQVDIRPANSVSTALQLIAVYFQIQSLNQFGGVAAQCIDWDLVPYVRKSFLKHWITGYEFLVEGPIPCFYDKPENISIEDPRYAEIPRVYRYAKKQIEKEVKQGIEALYHNLNSLQSRSGK